MTSLSTFGRCALALSAGALAAVYAPSAARAVVIVSVEAGAASDGPYAISNAGQPTTGVVSAAAGAGLQVTGVPSNDAILNPAPLPSCAACATVGPGSAGVGRAEANGQTGALKVRAEAYGPNALGGASARLQDTVTLPGSKIVNLSVDASTFAPSAAEFTFSFALGLFDNGNPDNPFTALYHFFADEEGYFIEAGGMQVASGSGMPGSLDVAFDLDPFLLPFTDTADLEIRMSASAQCGSDLSCVSQVIADNSLHLTFDGPYTSAEGYTYDGGAAPPPPTSVPAPGGGLILATALVALGWMRRRH